jgi:hypothetical protein
LMPEGGRMRLPMMYPTYMSSSSVGTLKACAALPTTLPSDFFREAGSGSAVAVVLSAYDTTSEKWRESE